MPQLRGNCSPGRFMKIVFPFHRGVLVCNRSRLCRHGQQKADFVEREKELCIHGLSVQTRLAM